MNIELIKQIAKIGKRVIKLFAEANKKAIILKREYTEIIFDSVADCAVFFWYSWFKHELCVKKQNRIPWLSDWICC